MSADLFVDPAERVSAEPRETPTASPAHPPEGRRRPSSVRAVVVAAVIAGIVSAGATVPLVRLTAPATDPSDPGTAPAAVGADTADVVSPSTIADVAAAASPSVAYVEVSSPGGRGSGSAVIIDADGYLLTNAHVVNGAQRISVTLADGTSSNATLVGADPTSDIAVLRIPANGLPALEGDIDVEIGDTVVAIGSPFGLEGTVTSGIVSGVDRTLSGGPGQEALFGMIQTDAAINPGNSGGALVDADGDLVGINTAIYSASGTSSGVGFAIPAGTALEIADQLITTGTVNHAQLGITGSDVNPQLANAYGINASQGALVAEVLPGSAADAAGLVAGDVIVGADGSAVTSMSELTSLIRSRTPGDVVVLHILRDGNEMQLDVALGSSS